MDIKTKGLANRVDQLQVASQLTHTPRNLNNNILLITLLNLRR